MYKSSLPVYRFLRVLGIFPYVRDEPGQAEFVFASKIVGYALTVFVLLSVRIPNDLFFFLHFHETSTIVF